MSLLITMVQEQPSLGKNLPRTNLDNHILNCGTSQENKWFIANKNWGAPLKEQIIIIKPLIVELIIWSSNIGSDKSICIKCHPNLQYMYLEKALDTEFLQFLFGQCLLLGLLVKSQEAVMLHLVCQAYIHSQSILVGTQALENQVTLYSPPPHPPPAKNTYFNHSVYTCMAQI